MKGSIVERNGKYSIVIYLGKDNFGKKKQRWISGFDTRKAAERELPRILVKLQDGELLENNKMTLGVFIENWLEGKIKKDNLSPTTIDGYRNIIFNHIIPTIGDLKLQEIKPYNIQKYINLKCEELSPKTLNNHKRVLTSALIHAVDMDIIEKNPILKVKFPREKKQEIKPYDLEETSILLDKIQKNKTLSVPVTLSIMLGLRRGECLGLRWSDIDFENNKINIRQNLEYVKGKHYFKDTKTINSQRTLSAPKSLMDYLREHNKWQKEMLLRSGGSWINEYNLVCTRSSDGKVLVPHSLSTMFSYFLKTNGMRHIRFHDLRHTNATLMLTFGTNSKVAMQRLGHSNVSITLGLYSHVLESVDKDVADKFDAIFSERLANGLAELK